MNDEVNETKIQNDSDGQEEVEHRRFHAETLTKQTLKTIQRPDKNILSIFTCKRLVWPLLHHRIQILGHVYLVYEV